MRYVVEPQRRLSVRESFDVVVVGGGIAGVAAAAAAVREGARVCLLEKEYGLGGLATLGNVIVYLPLCDGLGHQVSGGLAQKLLELSIVDGSHQRTPGCYGIPEVWTKPGDAAARASSRYVCAFNPATYAMELERWLLSLGVVIRYDARFAGVVKSRGVIKAVVIEDKGGRSAIACSAVVDASGDADVCLAAGEDLDSCEVNVACGWFCYLDAAGKTQLAKHSANFDFGAAKLPEGVVEGFACTDSRDVTRMVLASNRSIEQRLAEISAERKTPMTLLRPPLIPSYRMTRRLRGRCELTAADDRKWCEDAVGLISHWRMKGPVYAIPFRSLYGRTPNLVTAGRCISTARDVWDLTRVIPACAVTGEAAGAAAAMLTKDAARSFAALDIRRLQTLLRRRTVLLDRRLLDNSTISREPDHAVAGH